VPSPGAGVTPSAGPADEHAQRAARTYAAAADHYRLPALSFWDRFGSARVARLPLAPGHRVLDLCCGAGASALPAARAVGPGGQVLGVDLAVPLLELARARAAGEGLANVEFRHCDATRTQLPDGSFDAVVCVFGVFFVRDMTAFAAEMMRAIRAALMLASAAAAGNRYAVAVLSALALRSGWHQDQVDALRDGFPRPRRQPCQRVLPALTPGCRALQRCGRGRRPGPGLAVFSGAEAFTVNDRCPAQRGAILQKVAASAPGKPAFRRPAARPG
jgi:SAM-dependent methyltransferase